MKYNKSYIFDRFKEKIISKLLSYFLNELNADIQVEKYHNTFLYKEIQISLFDKSFDA